MLGSYLTLVSGIWPPCNVYKLQNSVLLVIVRGNRKVGLLLLPYTQSWFFCIPLLNKRLHFKCYVINFCVENGWSARAGARGKFCSSLAFLTHKQELKSTGMKGNLYRIVLGLFSCLITMWLLAVLYLVVVNISVHTVSTQWHTV